MSLDLQSLLSQIGEVKRVGWRWEVKVPPDRIADSVSKILKAAGMIASGPQDLHFVTIVGVDRPDAGEIELVYHFMFHKNKEYVLLRTSVKRDNPEIESITPIIPGAEMNENEVYDLLGVKFVGHPNLRKPFMTPENFGKDEFPLRKDWRR
ncbi:MAG: NADH-quinone oxidoreductase subunit C [Thermoproteota archaeon]|jgi:NADH:ubiquinone oxidoreductase subunit C|uniref:NADH-quinone oxidoreductase subunit C n=1 Tax=Candidatus Methanodesulfokora washburnensis TaxID=2478471 RepID=A0A3R9QAV2_9CREN|nr:NADH-quinone oxidoreductase subunit C [Candidatus Methanodesulfokores washburnensis]RSN71701.1 NADH-quinone oxidoreductase subunit C [Candidatus Methanodesulfokores washburnensis]RZN62089.1 MAG: NADH-quinone oxidoreductase subunit C [Candidatus Methanodesulfokores washburnensis]TDA40986.1 MAG: NADH-quinone oxidoreductase subunit C [Candidatus Korarchaeota archaeon]